MRTHVKWVRAHPVVMVSFSGPEGLKALRTRLKGILKDYEDFEVEELALYGDMEERLRRAGIIYAAAHEPSCIPPEQV